MIKSCHYHQGVSLRACLLDIVTSIAATPGVFDHGDSSLYGLKNYIARHSLARTRYHVSVAALAELAGHVDLKRSVRRGAIPKRFFTLEHPIPVSVVAREIKASDRTPASVASILEAADHVTIVTKWEDGLLAKKFRAMMPAGWAFAEDPLARYRAVGIELAGREIEVHGALVR